MSILSDPPPPLSLIHWIAATVLADLVFTLVFVACLYGALFFGDNARSLNELPDVLLPYLLGSLLPSLYLVSRARRRDEPTPVVWLAIFLAFVIAALMAIYGSILTGDDARNYISDLLRVQFFIIIFAGALAGAGTYYYLAWAKMPFEKKAG